jgi:hypothetical protein
MKTSPWFRALTPLALLSLVAVAQTGCASDVPTSEDEVEETVDSDADAITSSWKCDVGQIGSSRCQGVIADIRAQAGAAGRSEIIERGLGWLAEGIIYNRSGSYQGYRRDCSGFVSMAWQFSANPSTASFPPFVANKYAVELGSFDDLVPGDAVNKTFRNPYGHVMLFAGWASADHSQLYFLHHSATGKPVSLIQAARSGLGEFIPVRSIKAPPPAVNADPAPPAADPAPPAADPAPPAANPPAEGCGALLPNQSLGADQGVSSCDGRFTLVQQSDGNLVLYQAGGIALWSTVTSGSKGRVTVMQEDGNLVSYTPDGQPVWFSKTAGYPGAWLAIQDDGNLVIYAGKAIWSSGTSGH